MQRLAMRTGSGGLIAIECAVQWRQIVDDAFEIELDAVHQFLAIEAVPLEGIEQAFGTPRLHDEPDRSFLRPLRRMADMRRQQEDFALPDRHVVVLAVVDDLEHHVAAQLVEELLDRVVVEIGSLVGAADHGNHQRGVPPDLLIADRRLQQMLVFVDPFRETEGLKPSHQSRSPRAAVMTFTSPTPWTAPPRLAGRTPRRHGGWRYARLRSAPAAAGGPHRRSGRAVAASISGARAASRRDASSAGRRAPDRGCRAPRALPRAGRRRPDRYSCACAGRMRIAAEKAATSRDRASSGARRCCRTIPPRKPC